MAMERHPSMVQRSLHRQVDLGESVKKQEKKTKKKINTNVDVWHAGTNNLLEYEGRWLFFTRPGWGRWLMIRSFAFPFLLSFLFFSGRG